MKMIRNPKISAAVILVISAFYAMVFIFTSGHIEFVRLLDHNSTLNANFWNAWSDFLTQGHLKYIGYAYIALASAIAILSLVRKRGYDEYQTDILGKGFMIAGIAMACLFPFALLLILSDPQYCIETIILLVVVHWSAVLIAGLAYAVKWGVA